MSLSEAAVAIGLLTPLILGILAFIEKWVNRKKVEPPKPDEPEVVMGQTVSVDYAKELIEELKADRKRAEEERDQWKSRYEAMKELRRE